MMNESMNPARSDQRPSRAEVIAVYVIFAGLIARTVSRSDLRLVLGPYLSLEALFIVIFSMILWRPLLSRGWLHVYFSFQSVLILVLFTLSPSFDFAVILFIPLCYQAALFLVGRTRRLWIGTMLVLIASSMLAYQGIRGLALGLVPMAGAFMFATQIILNRQLQADRKQGQIMVAELQAINQQLQAYALQVEELTALEERNRLARELHDSVSQSLFSIALNTRSAQILLEREPARVREQLAQLHDQTQTVLAELRQFITGLRPKDG